MHTIYLIGGVDSFGVPYTRDNKNHKNHLRVVYEYLEQQGFLISLLDMYSMHTYNDTDYINSLLVENTNLYNIKENQQKSIDLCRRSGFFPFIKLPKKTKEFYLLHESDKEKNILSFLKQNQVLFIYSCGINDFLKHMHTDLSKLLIPSQMKVAFQELEKMILLVLSKIEANFKLMLEINPMMEIYVLGIYLPTRVSYIRKMVKGPIAYYNQALQNLCKNYKNVHYINNDNLTRKNMASVDWHPNYSGQVIMGENIIQAIEQYSRILKK